MGNSLTDWQKTQLKLFEPRLDNAVKDKNFIYAQECVAEIQKVLRPTEHYSRLIQSKNKLCELAIELNKCSYALRLLKSNESVVNNNTRVYLETISLIAICYLRMKEIDSAKKYIKLVLKNHTVIKTERTRSIFHSEIINRFNEEVTLATLTGMPDVYFNEDEIEKEAINIIQNLTNNEIYSKMGSFAPQATKDLIFTVHDYSIKQLPFTERLALPSPEQKVEDEQVGRTVFDSIKRVIFNSLCNPESEIYKAWYTNGMQFVLSKKYILTSVLSCLSEIGFGVTMIASSIVALIMKFGIEVYCVQNEPKYISDIRRK